MDWDHSFDHNRKAYSLAFDSTSYNARRKRCKPCKRRCLNFVKSIRGIPKKLNQEMMKFYKQHKVNPFAGCWPIMIQIPIFLGMFWMFALCRRIIWSGISLAIDLSEQDSITSLSGFSINLLPILMVATQWYQMKLNPMQMGPEMSEAQKNKCQDDEDNAVHVLGFSVFLFFCVSSLLDCSEYYDNFPDAYYKKEPIVDEKGKRIESVDLEDDSDLEKPRDSKILSEEEKNIEFYWGFVSKINLNPKTWRDALRKDWLIILIISYLKWQQTSEELLAKKGETRKGICFFER